MVRGRRGQILLPAEEPILDNERQWFSPRYIAKEKLDTYYAWAYLFSIWLTMTFNYTREASPEHSP
jgi:hypothetical protein